MIIHQRALAVPLGRREACQYESQRGKGCCFGKRALASCVPASAVTHGHLDFVVSAYFFVCNTFAVLQKLGQERLLGGLNAAAFGLLTLVSWLGQAEL